jgi:methylenetetrahydrofolate reductase (NADPH)
MSRALRPLFINVTWGAGGSTAGKSLELAEICQRQLGLTTCLHLTCTNMSQRMIDEALEKAKAIGVRNILALRGDPPRKEEYRLNDEDSNGHANGADGHQEFNWAVDLVQYIRKKYGDYFCIGVAAYPEGHSDQSHPENQDPKHDLPYLIQKTKAGADFLMTQLFYDVKAYEKFEAMLRDDPSGVFKTIPILPGLMPIQSYQILRRTTKLSHAKLPPDISERIEAVRGDDDAVKRVGVDILSEIVENLKNRPSLAPGPKGFHFYTLNLEKAVSQITERCGLIRDLGVESWESDDDPVVVVTSEVPIADMKARQRRRLSSINSNPRNRVVVAQPSTSSNKGYEALDHEAGVPTDGHSTRVTALQISEGQGALGREATWDDFPNGRWGDARSPAFGEIDGYGPTLHASFPQAIKMWGYPVTKGDISAIFNRHLAGELEAIPWSEEGFLPETNAIKDELLKLNTKGWWTVASQPAVNGVKSSDKTFGWGPKGGFCFQKVNQLPRFQSTVR